jgi:hypothetical protein
MNRRLDTTKLTSSHRLADLLQADRAFYGAVAAAEDRGEEITVGSPAHDAIMACPCQTLTEVRAKLQWMTQDGAGLSGEEEGFRLLLEDIDLLIEKGKPNFGHTHTNCPVLALHSS